MTNEIVPVILSGGAGTRLWPLSRPERPKQLLPVVDQKTMLQMTMARVQSKIFGAPIIVGNSAHSEDIERQLLEVGVSSHTLILEPSGRNTAPAIALAALAAGGGATPLLVMPSDHIIADVSAFHAAVQRALPFAEAGWLVTFGIAPTSPECGYGYIKKGDTLAEGVMRVDRFVEKPTLEVAEEMLRSGGYAWNGGIFLFRADAYLNALSLHDPQILTASKNAMVDATIENSRILPEPTAFSKAHSQSIDNAVMEVADKVAVVPVSMGWSDVGSWDALYEVSRQDEYGNACQGEVLNVETRNCLMRTTGVRIAAIGVSDLIIVADGNDVLIVPRGRSQELKKLTALM